MTIKTTKAGRRYESWKECQKCKGKDTITRTTRKEVFAGIICMRQWGNCKTCKQETEYYNCSRDLD